MLIQKYYYKVEKFRKTENKRYIHYLIKVVFVLIQCYSFQSYKYLLYLFLFTSGTNYLFLKTLYRQINHETNDDVCRGLQNGNLEENILLWTS